MFVGRERELISLNNSYNKPGFRFAVFYGRRRVGKSTLIREFCRDKKTIFFAPVQSTAAENIEILSEEILLTLAPGAPLNPFASFRAAVKYIFERAEDERIIFVIDEYPYLAESDGAVSSVLQAAIDKYRDTSQLFLILCGSAMSFMETQVLGQKSPLYGRRTAQYKIEPFDYIQSAQMLPGFSYDDIIALYSITGGVPEYLSRVDNTLSVFENIRDLLFDPAGRLFEEPMNLIKQELKMPETYNAIISAAAGGRTRLNDIAGRAGIETSQCSKMLGSLISLGLIRRELPVTEHQAKRPIYLLNDFLFIFWYRFVQPNMGRIIRGMGQDAAEGIYSGLFPSHIGRAFEECAKQYMWRAIKNLPFTFTKIGRWWGSNKALRREEEIDFIAFEQTSAYFGECKYRNTPTGEDVLDELIQKSLLLPQFTDRIYILFSKSGFTKGLKDRAAKDKRIILTELGDMFRPF